MLSTVFPQFGARCTESTKNPLVVPQSNGIYVMADGGGMRGKRLRYRELIAPNGSPVVHDREDGRLGGSMEEHQMMTNTKSEGRTNKQSTAVDEDWFTRIQRAKTAREQGKKAREGKQPVNPIPRTPLSLNHG